MKHYTSASVAGCVMNGLREALAGYLDLRRGLGFALERDAKLLNQFIAYLEERGSGTVTVTDALAWATLPPSASPGWLRLRMQVVRGACHFFRVSHGMTDTVTLSQGKSSWEEDSQSVQGHCPARCSRPGLASSLT